MSSSEPYRNRLRVRVCGVLHDEEKVLLVRLHSPVSGEQVWMPPGGGLQFGEPIESCLKREFREETGLDIVVEQQLFINEVLRPPFHAIELYYRVQKTGGSLKLGSDPEHERESQLLLEVAWIPLAHLSDISVVPEKLVDYLEAGQ